jgi:hypothetical protein
MVKINKVQEVPESNFLYTLQVPEEERRRRLGATNHSNKSSSSY